MFNVAVQVDPFIYALCYPPQFPQEHDAKYIRPIGVMHEA